MQKKKKKKETNHVLVSHPNMVVERQIAIYGILVVSSIVVYLSI
jgi:hypothetical protein